MVHPGYRTNLPLGIINEKTPLAQALLGLSPREVGDLQLPGQKRRQLSVLKILRQDDLSGSGDRTTSFDSRKPGRLDSIFKELKMTDISRSLCIDPCMDSTELGELRRQELDLPRAAAAGLGRSAVEAAKAGYH